MGPRWRLVAAAVAFLAWVGFLGYATLSKSRDPIVSHAQAAAATAAVVADLQETGEAEVVETLWGDQVPRQLLVPNCLAARGYKGAGRYLLFLSQSQGKWVIVGQQRSPGSDLAGVGSPLVYLWTTDVRKQAEKLRDERL